MLKAAAAMQVCRHENSLHYGSDCTARLAHYISEQRFKKKIGKNTEKLDNENDLINTMPHSCQQGAWRDRMSQGGKAGPRAGHRRTGSQTPPGHQAQPLQDQEWAVWASGSMVPPSSRWPPPPPAGPRRVSPAILSASSISPPCRSFLASSGSPWVLS